MSKTPRLLSLFCALAATGLAVTSAAPAAAFSTAAAEADDAILPQGSGWYWQKGYPKTPMGTASGRACFLTQVGGDFEEDTVIRAEPQGGVWQLWGSTPTWSLFGTADCMKSSSYTSEYSWQQGQGNTTMMPASTHTCFLTRVEGHLEGAGEMVEAKVAANGNWILTGASNQDGVAAGARCVARPAPAAEFVWNKGQAPVQMKPSGTFKCFLTRVQGEFEAYTEQVRVYEAGGSWWLHGTSAEDGAMQARARCVVTKVLQQIEQ